jgi:hypothetical protein
MKLQNEIEIPIDMTWDQTWIDYKKSVLLIRSDDDGNAGEFQFNGVACSQGYVKGYVHAQFKTKGKWFNEDWWYKKTCWGEDYPKRIFFCTDNSIYTHVDFIMNHTNETKEEINKSYAAFNTKTEELAELHGRPAANILANIIKIAKKKTGIDIEIDFPDEDTDYGVHWWEARIPVKFGNKFQHKGILTWMNCD